jgi:Plant transposon protein
MLVMIISEYRSHRLLMHLFYFVRPYERSLGGGEYGRQPKADDIRCILSINAMRGFPGCLGSIDCQHWQWERCPDAFAGQFTGKEKIRFGGYCGRGTVEAMVA